MMLTLTSSEQTTFIYCVTKDGALIPVAAKKSKESEEEDEPEKEDDWEKVEAEEEWDPDFDEFDVPKSRTAKSSGKSGEDESPTFEDEEVGDLFDDEGFDDDGGSNDDY